MYFLLKVIITRNIKLMKIINQHFMLKMIQKFYQIEKKLLKEIVLFKMTINILKRNILYLR
jgi:hypothetical protein